MNHNLVETIQRKLREVIERFEKDREHIPGGVYMVEVKAVYMKIKDQFVELHWILEILAGEYVGKILHRRQELTGDEDQLWELCWEITLCKGDLRKLIHFHEDPSALDQLIGRNLFVKVVENKGGGHQIFYQRFI
ncbi:MAG TPA: hypothetical protein PLQ35_16785 [bacterium]|nr:hypothetical protein [bacterium]